MVGKGIMLGIVQHTKVPFPTKTPDIYVCSHAFVANSFSQWIVHTRATRYIVQNKDDFGVTLLLCAFMDCGYEEWQRGRCPESGNIPT